MHDMSQQVMRTLIGRLAAVVLVIGLAACAGKPRPTAVLVWPSPPDEPRFYWDQTIRSSGDVVEETQADKLKRIATGQSRAGTPFEKPVGVAAFNNRLYVSDGVGREIHFYDFVAKTYKEIGTSGEGSLAKPLGLATDGQGRVYAADALGRRVVVYDGDGNFLASVGGKSDFERPVAVGVNREGTRIYVADIGGVDSERHDVSIFNEKGEKLKVFGKRGTETGEFNFPDGVATGPDGTVYVLDSGNFRVQAFSPEGKFLRTFGELGRKSGQFARPKNIAADSQGNLYVTDAAFNNFQIFDPQGQLLLFIGEPSDSGGPAKFLLPAGIGVDPVDGRIYVADEFLAKVEVYRPAATPEGRPGKAVASKDADKPAPQAAPQK